MELNAYQQSARLVTMRIPGNMLPRLIELLDHSSRNPAEDGLLELLRTYLPAANAESRELATIMSHAKRVRNMNAIDIVAFELVQKSMVKGKTILPDHWLLPADCEMDAYKIAYWYHRMNVDAEIISIEASTYVKVDTVLNSTIGQVK